MKDKDRKKDTAPRTLTQAVPPEQPERPGESGARVTSKPVGESAPSGRQANDARFGDLRQQPRRSETSGYTEAGHLAASQPGRAGTALEEDQEIAAEEEIPFERWKNILEIFTIGNQGRTVRVEVKRPEQSEFRREANDTVLQGVSISDDDREARTISIFLGKERAQHATHTLSAVKQLLVLRNERGTEQGIELLSGENLRTRVIATS